MATDLKEGEGESGFDNITSGGTDPVFESGNGNAEGGEDMGEVREEDTPGGDESELDEGESNGFGESIENGFGGGVGEGGTEVPDKAEKLRCGSQRPV